MFCLDHKWPQQWWLQAAPWLYEAVCGIGCQKASIVQGVLVPVFAQKCRYHCGDLHPYLIHGSLAF